MFQKQILSLRLLETLGILTFNGRQVVFGTRCVPISSLQGAVPPHKFSGDLGEWQWSLAHGDDLALVVPELRTSGRACDGVGAKLLALSVILHLATRDCPAGQNTYCCLSLKAAPQGRLYIDPRTHKNFDAVLGMSNPNSKIHLLYCRPE